MSAGLTAGVLPRTAETTIRLAVAALATAGAALALAHLPAWAAAVLCAAFGVVLALPSAVDAAVATGHRLSRHAPGSPARWLLAGPVLRVGLAGALGTGLAAVLLVRLSAGGPGIWAVAALVATTTAISLRSSRALARRIWVEAHAGVGARRLAQSAGALAALPAVLLAGYSGALPDPALAPGAASALVAEAHALHRLWAGAEAFLLGQAVALSVVPPWLAVVGALAGTAAVGLAVARLTVAALMDPTEAGRGLLPVPDGARTPSGRVAGPVAAGAVGVAAVLVALWAEGRLASLPPEDRPVARLQVTADRIGQVLYPPGTVAGLVDRHDELVRADTDLAVRMRAATDAGFDRVVANVDPFLDGYYSLWGEYARLIDLGRGQLEERLTGRLSAALAEDAPFAEVEALWAEVDALRDRARAMADPAAAMGGHLPPLNPGEIRVGASIDLLPPLPDLRTAGLSTTVEVRAGIGVAAGAIGALVARRVVARLAARGTLAVAVRAVPLVGLAVGVVADAAVVELEEAMNRDAFRAEIVAGIEAQRADALALFD